MSNNDKINAAENLCGYTLKTGWYVKEAYKPKASSTGGHFSISYLVEKNGIVGFMKVLNFLAFMQSTNQASIDALSLMLQSFEFEKKLLHVCNNRNFSKISKLLDSDVENIPGYIISSVPYIIFEKADGDIRQVIKFTLDIDTAWKLRSLHNISVGLMQLHSADISHQDLKPSNIFVFNKNISKVGDLGRSLCHTLDGPHSKLSFSGDLTYQPPEYIYGYHIEDWHIRTFSADCFLLGSMITFYFAGTTMMQLISLHSDVSKISALSGGRYEQIIPYLTEGLDKSLEFLNENDLKNNPYKTDLLNLISKLCHPDPERRATKKNIFDSKYNFDLQPVVSKLDLLAKKAEYNLTH